MNTDTPTPQKRTPGPKPTGRTHPLYVKITAQALEAINAEADRQNVSRSELVSTWGLSLKREAVEGVRLGYNAPLEESLPVLEVRPEDFVEAKGAIMREALVSDGPPQVVLRVKPGAQSLDKAVKALAARLKKAADR